MYKTFVDFGILVINEIIKKVLFSYVLKRSVAKDAILEIWKLIMNHKGLPSDMRLYIVTKNEQLYVNKGFAEKAYYSNITSKVRQKRDTILEPFTKIEFILDELIRLYIVGFESRKQNEFLNLLDAIGSRRKIELLYKWKIITNNLKKRLENLFQVRNGVAHDLSMYEVRYQKKPLFHTLSQANYNKFLKDLEKTWNDLVKTYLKAEKKINWTKLIEKIKRYQYNQTKKKSTTKKVTKKKSSIKKVTKKK